jgi:predicted esterase
MGSNDAGFHWGDDVLFDESTGGLEFDAGFTKGLERLRDVVGVLVGTCGYKEREVVFYGFGQGAMLALLFVQHEKDKEYGGVVSIGGKLPASLKGAGKARTPVLVCGGSRSKEVTKTAVVELREKFGEAEYVKWDRGEDGMPRNKEEMFPVMKFFARRLRSRAGVPEGAVEV